MACSRTEEEWLELPVSKVKITELTYGLDESFHPALIEDLRKWRNYQPVRVCVQNEVKRLHNGRHRVEAARAAMQSEINARVCHCGAP
jgi:hypothetical protein